MFLLGLNGGPATGEGQGAHYYADGVSQCPSTAVDNGISVARERGANLCDGVTRRVFNFQQAIDNCRS